MTEDKIDIVVLWVDGSDPEFIREKQAVTGQVADLDQESTESSVIVITGFLITGFE